MSLKKWMDKVYGSGRETDELKTTEENLGGQRKCCWKGTRWR